MAKYPFLISLGLTIILVLISRKPKYLEEIEDVLKKDYSLKDLLFIGFYIIDIVGIDKLKKLSSDAYGKIISIYGLEGEKNFRYYVANKLVLSIFTISIVNMFQAGEEKISFLITIGSIASFFVMFFLADTMINEKFEKRSLTIKYEVPEFLSKITLMLNAGLTFENALERVLESSNKENPLYYELGKTCKDIRANIPREKCLNDFSRRCKISELTKFTTVVLQNINKGTTDLSDALHLLAKECWDGRKFLARKKGEEASSKLLFPMMMMLIAVFIIVIVPAFMSMLTGLV